MFYTKKTLLFVRIQYMVFSSLPFLFFLFPIFLIGIYFSSFFNGTKFRNSFIIFLSLIFYLWEESTDSLFLIAICLINWFGALGLSNQKHRKKIFIGLILLNLSFLFAFKYSLWCLSFFTDYFLHKNIMLLGISFFIFHAISYITDVYTKKIVPCKSLADFQTYFYMFPHLVAGPIVRFAQIQDDLTCNKINKELFSFGMYRFLLGLNKKILIANSVSLMADYSFTASNPEILSFSEAWLGIIAYALQIYFDFSAYSDMAIGLAAMAGFHFEENFNRPYISTSIREFWKRWHISLSTWLRDYIYIPCGGSRQGSNKTYRNLLLVFLLCGIWHGANFTFIIWGLWHGLFICLERMGLSNILEKLPKILRHCYLLLVVLLGWVFFRAENLSYALNYLTALFNFSSLGIELSKQAFPLFFMAVGITVCFLPQKFIVMPTVHTITAFKSSHLFFQFILSCASVCLLLSSGRNPFIYFNF